MISVELESCGCPKGSECFCIRDEDIVRRPCGCPVSKNCRCINPYLENNDLIDKHVYECRLLSGARKWLRWNEEQQKFNFVGGCISSEVYKEINNSRVHDVYIISDMGYIPPQR